MDGAVDDQEHDPGGRHHLLAVCDNNLREVPVGRMILHKERLPTAVWAMMACEPAMMRPTIVIFPWCMAPESKRQSHRHRHLAWLVRHEGRHEGLSSIDAFALPQKLPEGRAVIP